MTNKKITSVQVRMDVLTLRITTEISSAYMNYTIICNIYCNSFISIWTRSSLFTLSDKYITYLSNSILNVYYRFSLFLLICLRQPHCIFCVWCLSSLAYILRASCYTKTRCAIFNVRQWAWMSCDWLVCGDCYLLLFTFLSI